MSSCEIRAALHCGAAPHHSNTALLRVQVENRASAVVGPWHDFGIGGSLRNRCASRVGSSTA
jgi:hypothetical protein